MGGLLNAIAQGPQPVQIANPLQRQAQIAQVQNLQGEAQERNLLIERQRREMASQDAISKAWAAAGGDLDKTVEGAVQNGALPEHVVALQKHVIETKEKLQKLKTDELETNIKHADIAGGHINALLQQPEEQAAQAWTPLISSLIQKGDLKTEDMKAAGLDPMQYPGHAAAQNFLLGMNGYKGAAAQALAERKAKVEESTAATAAAKESREAKTAGFELGQKERAAAIAQTAGLEDKTLNPQVGQAKFDQFLQAHPEMAKELGPQWNPNAIAMLQRQAVPVEKQPEFDLKGIEAAAAKSSNPEGDAAMIDSVIDPKSHADLNKRTRGLVATARANGMPPAAIAGILKDGADQIGRTETAVATAKATAPIKIYTAGAEATARGNAMNPGADAIDMMAEKTLAGQPPPAGRNPMLLGQVYKRAAEIAKERGMTAQQAVMEGNAAHANVLALNSVTKQYETLKPFGEMAEKNAKVLEQKMDAVSDLGTSLLNTPLREVEQKFGSTKVTAMKAAMMPVQADFARILNSPTGAGVLSDDARHEMQKAVSEGATVGQIKAALDVFRTDWRNRKETYDKALQDLKGKTVAGGGTPAATATHTYNPQTGKIEVINK